MQQNKESERGEIVRLMDERYAPDYSEVIKRAFEFNRERKIDSTFNQKWWTVGFRDQYVVDSIPIPLLIGTRRSELDVNLKQINCKKYFTRILDNRCSFSIF